MDSTYITVNQVAERWQIKPRSVHDMLRAGEIKGFKLHNEWRVSLASVVAFEERPVARISGAEAEIAQYAAGAIVKKIT